MFRVDGEAVSSARVRVRVRVPRLLLLLLLKIALPGGGERGEGVLGW